MKHLSTTLLVVLLMVTWGGLAFGAERTSTNYKLQGDTISTGGGEGSSSTNYKSSESLGEQGDSTPSSTNYNIFSAFRHFFTAATASFQAVHFRFYANEDAVQPTDPWPPGASDLATDSALTDTASPPAQGTAIRLRMASQVNAGNLNAGQTFKLQFGLRSSTCAVISSWTDLGAIGSSGVWRGLDNAAATDGALVSATLLAGSTVKGTYEEANNSAAALAVTQGGVIEHDWVVQNNSGTPGATYCFRMTQASGTPFSIYSVYPQISLANVVVSGGGGGGGGGGGSTGIINGPAAITLKGITSPGAKVSIFSDNLIIKAVVADASGAFSSVYNGVDSGLYSFTIWSVDGQGTRSLTLSIAVNVPAASQVTLSNILLSPTVYVPQVKVSITDAVHVTGFAAPLSTVVLQFASADIQKETTANVGGQFNYALAAKDLGLGDHTVKAQMKKDLGLLSPFSETTSFSVVSSLGQELGRIFRRADLNSDGAVNLTDLSILLANFSQRVFNLLADINKNGNVDLADLSILLYEWNS